MPSATVATQTGLSLSKLQLIAQQQEGIFGPLKRIYAEKGKNVLEFEVGVKPRVRVVLKKSDQDAPGPRKGYVLVCTGDCFIAGAKSRVAAYRKT